MIVTHILAVSPSPTVYNARSKPTTMDSVVERVSNLVHEMVMLQSLFHTLSVTRSSSCSDYGDQQEQWPAGRHS